jgi:phage-related protein
MSREMSAAQIDEVSKSEVKTRDLLTIIVDPIGGDVLRILENDTLTTLSIAGQNYVAGMVKRGEIESTTDGIVSKVGITISNIAQEISSIIANKGDVLTNKIAKIETVIFNGDPPKWQPHTAYSLYDFVSPSVWTGYIYQCTVAGTSGEDEPVFPQNLGIPVNDGTCQFTSVSPFLGEPVLIFEGAINNIQLTCTEFTFDIERILGGYSTVSPNMTYDVNCQVKKFKDARCGYTGSASTCDKSYKRCKELGNTLRFAGFPTIVQQQVIRS